MTTYAIGDIQGCFEELLCLLDKIQFDPGQDRLWLTGDLVNRGPKSLETLRFIKNLGDSAVTVLGNHDLHLLACAHGAAMPHRSDTFDPILGAEDKKELLDWLLHRPLLHYDQGICLVHASLAPQWDLDIAIACAQQAEGVLRDKEKKAEFFDHMYGDQPDRWNNDLTGWPRVRFIVNAFTRARFCDYQTGRIDLKHKGKPGSQPANLIPWFEHPERKTCDLRIVFGHWSSLGLSTRNGAYCLDTGCLWGGPLTALRIDDEEETFFQITGKRRTGETRQQSCPPHLAE